MSKTQIKFGTDGWRAIIGDTYTFENVEKVSQATALWVKKNYPDNPRICLGYDCRFLGRQFAERSAQVFATMGVAVQISETFVTTPAISWATKAYDLNAGIVITASHNPPEYNGFKIKSEFGGPATPATIDEVEAELPNIQPLALKSYADLVESGAIQSKDIGQDYVNMIAGAIDCKAISESGLKVAHDAMYGAGQGIVQQLLGKNNVVALHHDLNPGFHGQAPEPIERNLQPLSDAILKEGCDVGIANDGDADRIGMYDEKGVFVDSHKLLCLLVKYMHETKQLRGDIIKTFSATDMLYKMGEKLGIKVITTPIGFKYIGGLIVEGDVLVGGEESGGMAVKGHIPERDGVYIGLLIVEMMVKLGKKLSELVQELFDEYGEHHAYRVDMHTTEERKLSFLALLKSEGLKTAAGRTVNKTETIDGYKFRTDDGWVMVRPSGTEPVLRVYSEAPTPEIAKELVLDTVNVIENYKFA